VIVRERSAWRELTLLTAALQAVHFGSLSFGDCSEDRLFMVAPAPRHLLAGATEQALYPVSPGEAFSLQELPGAVAMAGMRRRGWRVGEGDPGSLTGSNATRRAVSSAFAPARLRTAGAPTP